MKRILIVAISLLITANAFGQRQNLKANEVTEPQFTGINNLFTLQKESANLLISKYLMNEIIYPEQAINCHNKGTEVVQFTVTRQRKLTDFKVINSVSPNLDDQIIQNLKITSGKWNPAMVAGKPVPMEKEVSITFFLHSEKDLIKLAKDYQEKGNEWMFVKENPEKAL